MGDSVMKQEELEAIGGYVKTHIAQWLKESKIIPIEAGYQIRDYEREVSLAERIVRVEEGIKHQGEVLEKILHQIDKRFEQNDRRIESLEESMNKRFEQNDRRIESLEESMNKRFEQVDKHFEQIDKRFEQVDKHFELVDKRFGLMEKNMDSRFAQVDKRFSQLQWSMGIGFTTIAALMGVFNFF